MGVVPKKSEARSDQTTANDCQLSRSRQITDKKIIGDQQMSRRIRHQRINKRHRDRAPDRQAIDAIGQIDRVARSGDDQKKEERIHNGIAVKSGDLKNGTHSSRTFPPLSGTKRRTVSAIKATD